jgi:hypothetical protein
MAHPQVADGEGLQMWRVVAKILNKQWRTANNGLSSSGGWGLTNPHRKKSSACYLMLPRTSECTDFVERPKKREKSFLGDVRENIRREDIFN